MPTLPPFEASLLLAAESCKDVLVAREWRACELELAKEGVVPMAADRSRIAATVHSGGSRIDGVWSAQHEMLTEELSRDMNVETMEYHKLASAKSSDPMNLPPGAKLPKSKDGRSLEQRRRGQLAM